MNSIVVEDSRKEKLNHESAIPLRLNSADFIEAGSFDSIVNLEHSAINPQQLKILKMMISNADLKKRAYSDAERKFRCVSKWHNLIQDILAGIFSGGALIETIKMSSDDPDKTYKIIIFIFSILIVIVRSSDRAIKPDSKAQAYKLTANDYSEYSRKLRNALSSGIDDRQDKVNEFMINAENDFGSIESNSIPL